MISPLRVFQKSKISIKRFESLFQGVFINGPFPILHHIVVGESLTNELYIVPGILINISHIPAYIS